MNRHRSRQERDSSRRQSSSKRSQDHSRSDSHSYRTSERPRSYRDRDARQHAPSSQSRSVRNHSPHRRENLQSEFDTYYDDYRSAYSTLIRSISSPFESAFQERETNVFKHDEISQSGAYYSRADSGTGRYTQERRYTGSRSPVNRRRTQSPGRRRSAPQRQRSASPKRRPSSSLVRRENLDQRRDSTKIRRQSPSRFQKRHSPSKHAGRQRNSNVINATSAVKRNNLKGERKREKEAKISGKRERPGRLRTNRHLGRGRKQRVKQVQEQLRKKIQAKESNGSIKRKGVQARYNLKLSNKATARSRRWAEAKGSETYPKQAITRKVQPKASSRVRRTRNRKTFENGNHWSGRQQVHQSGSSLYDDKSRKGLELERSYRAMETDLPQLFEEVESGLEIVNRVRNIDNGPFTEERDVGRRYLDGEDEDNRRLSLSLQPTLKVPRSDTYQEELRRHLQTLPSELSNLPGQVMRGDGYFEKFAPADNFILTDGRKLLTTGSGSRIMNQPLSEGSIVGAQPAIESFIINEDKDSMCMVKGCSAKPRHLRQHVLNHLPPCFDDKRVDDLSLLQVQSALLWLLKAIVPLGRDLPALVDIVNGSKLLKEDHPIRNQSVLRMNEICRRLNVTVPSKFQMCPVNSVAVLSHWRVAGLLLNFLSDIERFQFLQLFGEPTAKKTEADSGDDIEEEGDRIKYTSYSDAGMEGYNSPLMKGFAERSQLLLEFEQQRRARDMNMRTEQSDSSYSNYRSTRELIHSSRGTVSETVLDRRTQQYPARDDRQNLLHGEYSAWRRL